jgi:CheY-like chemotaxis protein
MIGPVLKNCRILIVEDEPVLALELVSILEDEGAIVVAVAQSVASALDTVREYWINCALLDIHLNGESSYPVADALSELNLPFAFVTGYSESAPPPQHIQRPVINKPFSATHVIEAVATMAWR